MSTASIPFTTAGARQPLPVINALMLIDGKIPLLRRHKGTDSWWDLPGGKPDSAEESYADTILRELDEELGIKACVLNEKPVAEMDHPFIPGARKIFMVCGHVSGQAHNALPEEHDELKLADAEEAVALLGTRITPQVAQAIRDLEKSARPPMPVTTGSRLAL